MLGIVAATTSCSKGEEFVGHVGDTGIGYATFTGNIVTQGKGNLWQKVLLLHRLAIPSQSGSLSCL